VPRIAIATCAELPHLFHDDLLLESALKDSGAEVLPAVWTDESVDWPSFDAVLVRSTWDYSLDRDAFLSWIRRVDSVTMIMNEALIHDWNTDKHYLVDLSAAGVPVTPTEFVEPGSDTRAWQAALTGEVVVKPAISAGSRDAFRFATGDVSGAQRHVDALVGQGRSVMVQPYLHAVDSVGETALVYLDGEFSHAIRKGPLLVLSGDAVTGLFAPESIDPRSASDQELQVAEQVLAAIPSVEPVLYARVDLIPDSTGAPLLSELELCEPSLFFEQGGDAAERMARAVIKRVENGRLRAESGARP
jgi:glutathione synthase/RimK-type ligase-like ATP-grasp enzyme